MRLLCLVLLLILPVALSACNSHSLRSGIWELTYNHIVRTDNQEALPIPRKEARVEIDWAQDAQRPNVVEEAEISVLGTGPGGTSGEGAPVGQKSMFADIESRGEENEKFLRIESKDKDWTWRMYGVIVDAENVHGLRFDGALRSPGGVAFEGGQGSWRMRWLRDE